MPNVDLLCLITGADIDGSVCASRSAAPRRKGEEEKRKGGEGGIGSGCLFAKSPLSPCGSGRRRSDGGALGHCRTKWPAILSSWSRGFAWGGSEGVGRGRPSDTGN